MKLKKIAVGLSVIVVTNLATPTIRVFANEINQKTLKVDSVKGHASIMERFEIENNENFEKYKMEFKISQDLIESVFANGGNYATSNAEKAIDGDIKTHWETGKPNSDSFTNEFTIAFKDIVSIDKMTYKVRQDSGTKGFLSNYEIYASTESEGDDFNLITSGSGTPTKDTVEIKFNETEAKRIKIIFVGANSNWASMSEVGFYKSDIVREAMNNLFIDNSNTQVSENFNNIDKLNELEELVKKHPFYNDYKNQIEDAKAIVESTEIITDEAKSKKFIAYDNSEYNKLFKMNNSNIESIKNNAGNNRGKPIDYAIDEDINTAWESNKVNSDTFNNEVEIIFKNRVILDRVVYGARQSDAKGFAQEFEIHVSNTSQGDNYKLLSTGSYNSTTGLIEAKFKETEIKRIKFKFNKSKDNWATISEIAFYKKDEVGDKIDTLFTDDTYSVVNEEFNSLEKLEKLESEIKNHPLYEDFIEKIEDAKVLVSDTKVDPSIARTKQFNLYNNKEYNNSFKMNNSNIKSIKNNAGNNSGKYINNAIDEDIDTAWESNTLNSDTFTNEVEIEFKEKALIDRVVYGARQSDLRGFALEFEIYGSKTSVGDTYELISTAKHDAVTGMIEAKFEPTEFKRVKFKFTKSQRDWATISEIAFYKEDTLADEVNSIFEDELYMKISDKYSNIESITKLENSIKNHPIKEELMQIIDAAKDILEENNIEKSEVITLSQRGDEDVQKSERRRVYAGGNLDVTGYYVMPGESIEVYVDSGKKDIVPHLVFSHVGEVDDNNKGNHRVTLSIGRNIVTAPEGTKGFAVYFANKALPEEQEYAPRVRLQGDNLNKYPVYIHGKTDADEYKEAVKNHKGANMTDVLGDRFLLSAQNSEAKIAYIDNGYSPLDTVREMEEMISIFDMIGGYDENDENPIHRPSKALYHLKMTDGSGLFASNQYTHLGAVAARTILSGTVYGWGNLHEFAHQVENRDMRLLEVSNNIYSSMAQLISGKNINNLSGNQKIIDKYFTFEGTKGFGGFPTEDGESFEEGELPYELTLGLFERLLVLTQITNYFGIESYAKANRLVRENPTRYATGDFQATITALSEATGYDLAEHFEYYNYPVDEKTKEFTSQFKKLDKKIRYTTLDSYNMNKNNEAIFTEETKAVIKDVKAESDGYTLEIGTNDNHKSVIAYEIYRDGEFVGFNRDNIFKDIVDPTKKYDYEVIAYDYKVNESIKSETVNSEIGFRPNINIDNNTILLKLNEEFNPLDYIDPKSYNGGHIELDRIEVLENNVDISKKGMYKVVYKLEDRGQTAISEINFEVVSDIDYASDIEWISATSGWRTVNKDKAVGSDSKIKLNIDGKIKEFRKGIGSAANSEIVYDLSDKDYDYFETYVGVDKSYSDQNRTSIDFKIIADGEEIYRSETMKKNSKADYIKIPIKGIKELKLIADNHDGDGYGDYSSWGDAKFITDNSKPTLKIEDSIVTKVRNPIENIVGNFSAIDIEDGDITDKVVVSGHENINFNKPGKYTIKYEITDSDNNVVTKERTITIVSDIVYASDIEWISATSGWKTVNKDKAVASNNKIKLNVDGKIVEFNKGIGVATNSEIVYDLTDKNYTHFSTYLGTDKNYDDNRTTIDFKILADGKEVYKSETIKRNSNAEYISLDVTGVKELKLVADDSNGNGIGDFASWADTKFYITNSKPNLQIQKSESIKVGETIDNIIGEFKATDIEDGDITDKVVVSGHENINFNKPGEYKIKYSVTDSDGNTATNERSIAIVDMNDFKYLTEFEWTSAKQSYSTAKKDTNQAGDKLRLTDEDGKEVVYDRGIGAHATATIIYDLSDKNYDYFTSYVGVDRVMYSRPASVSFEVYVDGEIKYDSGLMTGKTPQQFVEVDINGAKELKLIVKDGGNGNGSDHATWADTKLHFANSERVDITGLNESIEKSEKLDTTKYTEESVSKLNVEIKEVKKLLEVEFISQVEYDKAIKAIEVAINNLELNVDLDEGVKIEDKLL